MSDTDPARESLLKKLQAIKARTQSAGCTEAEALEAAAKLAELMDRHGFDEAALNKPQTEPIIEKRMTSCGPDIGNLYIVLNSVANYCDVMVYWYDKHTYVLFYGRKPDVEFAEHLMLSFKHAMKRAWFDYKLDNPGVSKVTNTKRSFEEGMMYRLASRLYDMKDKRNNHVDLITHQTGHSLVVAKKAAVDEAWQVRGIKLKVARPTRQHMINSAARMAGRAAGDEVNITTGIGAG